MNEYMSMDSLRGNSIVMENLSEMMLAQEGRKKLHYTDYALEALVNPEGQAVFLDKLYKETQKLEGIDFGRIPDTRGDITKYQYYDQLNDEIELINKLAEGNQTPSIISMNKLHQILLDARGDFAFGFKSDNYVIINTYKCLALALFEMANICTVDVTNYLRAKLSITLNKKTSSEIRSMTKTVNQFIKLYESGQWATMMKAFKSGKALESATAMEGDWSVTVNGADPKALWSGAKKVGSAAKDVLKGIPELVGKITGTKLGKVGVAVTAIIALLWIIRKAFYLFFHGAGNLKQILKNNAEILKVSISNDGEGVEAQKKLLSHLEKASDVIEYNILKTEREANADNAKADREVFDPNEFRNISGSDFEF